MIKFIADHDDRACGIVKEMLEQITAKMKELGLKSLRLEGEPTIIAYTYDGINYIGLQELTVQGILLSDEDGLVLKTQPYSQSIKFTNECVTGPDCPEIDYNKDYDFLAVDSDDLEYFTILNLDPYISDAFDTYEENHHDTI